MKTTERILHELLIAAVNKKAGRSHEHQAFTRNKFDDMPAGLHTFAVLPNARSAIAGFGDDNIQTSVLPIVSCLKDLSILKDYATWLNVQDPVKGLAILDQVTAAYKADVTEDAGEWGATPENLGLTYNRITAHVPVDRPLIFRDNPDVVNQLFNILVSAIVDVLESKIFGVQARTAIAPQGIGYKITTGADTAAAAVPINSGALVDLEYDVAMNAGLKGNLAYVTSPKGMKKLKTTAVESGDARRILEDGKANGYKVLVSNNVSDAAGSGGDGALLTFANWKELAVIQAGPYYVTVDPFTLGKYDKAIITVNTFIAIAGMRGQAATDEDPATTDPDEYTKICSSIAIAGI